MRRGWRGEGRVEGCVSDSRRERQEKTAKEKTGSYGANTQGNSEARKWVV